MSFYRLGDIVVGVKKALEWYESIGVPTANTRLSELFEFLTHHLLNPASAEGRSLAKGEPTQTAYAALMDGVGFIEIRDHLSMLSSSLLPRRVLRSALQGPLAVEDECDNSNAGRNFFSELELAAHLSQAGFRPLAFNDLTVEIEGVPFTCECKRPFRRKGLPSNISVAYSGLSKRLKTNSERGLVCIVVERVFDLHRRMVRPGEVDELLEEVAHLLDASAEEWIDKRIVGVLGIVRFLVDTGDPRNPAANYVLALVKRAALPADDHLLDGFILDLRRGFRSRSGP